VEYVLPPELGATERLPVVVVLHGVSTNPWMMQNDIGLGQEVVDRRFIAVFPHGIAESWNAGDCCRPAMTLGIDDVAFLDAVVTDASRRPEVDPSRIFMVGESNGGIMTYRYLCDHADRLAGAASVVGTNLAGCPPNEPIPLLHVAASADEVIRYSGGHSTTSRLLASADFPPVVSSIERIATAESCGRPTTSTQGAVEVMEWPGCDQDVPLRLVTVIGAKHKWPRGDTFDATTAILDFFGLGRG
jgi:polyhydroxybutyrate depolymerase